MRSWLKGYMRNIITDFNTHSPHIQRMKLYHSHSMKVIKGVLFPPSGHQACGVTSNQRRSQIVFKG